MVKECHLVKVTAFGSMALKGSFSNIALKGSYSNMALKGSLITLH